LNEEERKKLVDILELDASITFNKAKKFLGLKPKEWKFSLESGGEKNLIGNRINSKLKDIFGDAWENFSAEDRDKVLHDLTSFEKEWALAKRAKEKWGLSQEKAEELGRLKLEKGYCNLSLKAIRKLLPFLEQGLSYPEAATKVYGSFRTRTEIQEKLPSVDEALRALRNPVVHRSLSELRRCVNPIIHKYGKPDIIRVELARDLKQTRRQREERIKTMRANENVRKSAAMELEKNGIANPSRSDILKYQLAEECNWICPYTQKSIGWSALFGKNPEFDVEHIIPFSRSLDDSFMNKTLCNREENARKRNRTPFESYGNDPDRYELILQSVGRFKGKARREKYSRFIIQSTEIFEDFSARHLNDTRYASKEAVNLLSHLYGSTTDIEGRLRIQTVKGPITALLRNFFGINSILGDGGKTREDHRHHAIDALVVALTSPLMIKNLSAHAARYGYLHRVPYGESVPPWEGAVEEAAETVKKIIPVHRRSLNLSGPLHEETFYGHGPEKKTAVIRTRLEDMTANDANKIVDPAVRNAVLAKLVELGEENPKKAFARPENRPLLTGRDGRSRWVNSARIEIKLDTFSVGSGDNIRNVQSERNHHMEIYATFDEQGNEIKWDGEVVSLFEAYQRRKNRQSVIKKDFGQGKRFKFSLSSGDIVEMEAVKGKREIFVVRTVPLSKQIAFVKVNDARMKKDILKAVDWITKFPNTLRSTNCRKVFLTPFGEVRYAND
jgi:CRISPR-associated endonuclease Csn1